MRILILVVLLFLLTNCTAVEVIKPAHLYYDYDTNKRITNRWSQIHNNPTEELISEQLLDYELLRERHNRVILENNKLADRD